MTDQEIRDLFWPVLGDAAIERVIAELKNNNLTIKPIENASTKFNFTSEPID